MPMTLADWLDYQQRIHPRAIELGLDRVRAVWRRMDSPQPAPVVITVGGTNGKGSTIAFLEAMLRAVPVMASDVGGIPEAKMGVPYLLPVRSIQKYETRLFAVYDPNHGSAFLRAIATAKLRDQVGIEGSLGWFSGSGPDAIGRFSDSDFLYVRLKYFF